MVFKVGDTVSTGTVFGRVKKIESGMVSIEPFIRSKQGLTYGATIIMPNMALREWHQFDKMKPRIYHFIGTPLLYGKHIICQFIVYDMKKKEAIEKGGWLTAGVKLESGVVIGQDAKVLGNFNIRSGQVIGNATVSIETDAPLTVDTIYANGYSNVDVTVDDSVANVSFVLTDFGDIRGCIKQNGLYKAFSVKQLNL